MGLALLMDIGSTYTKAAVVDLKTITLQAKAKSFTTVTEDVNIGVLKVLDELKSMGVNLESVEYKLACSSAAGGLKMVAIGLVPDLTAEAAKRAALGAGAKVAKVYSYELANEELQEIIDYRPDVILLAGGTDGGNKDIIKSNAKMLANSPIKAPIVLAGNKVVTSDIEEMLLKAEKEVYATENVMPKLEQLNIEPARKTIRQVFLNRIIYAKGLSKVKNYTGNVIMPTPSAVMKAAELIANGTDDVTGFGELMVVDIGGATTDIDSVASGKPTKGGVTLRGLEEPYVKRTVEGDLGMRYSASAVIEAVGAKKLLKHLPGDYGEKELMDYIYKISKNVEHVPENSREREMDNSIAKVATKLAVNRHVGRIDTVYGPFGSSYVQHGKDLTQLSLVIGTGGVLVHGNNPRGILEQGLFDEAYPEMLAPKNPELMLDSEYILSSIGLLAEVRPKEAILLAKKYLKKI